ncbi:hypothetical protein, partial [Ligilactobacillus animalis]|uniref:hypothetical protein n=1 Tax=Ligilactobacillus animalis TaxID=1605 RepID=UPI001F1CB63A
HVGSSKISKWLNYYKLLLLRWYILGAFLRSVIAIEYVGDFRPTSERIFTLASYRPEFRLVG